MGQLRRDKVVEYGRVSAEEEHRTGPAALDLFSVAPGGIWFHRVAGKARRRRAAVRLAPLPRWSVASWLMVPSRARATMKTG